MEPKEPGQTIGVKWSLVWKDKKRQPVEGIEAETSLRAQETDKPTKSHE